jgi:uncharacterized membrane protein
MNGAHFHLVVNHFPVILPIIGVIILLVGFFIKSEVVKRTAYLLFVFGAIFSIFAMNSGEEAEEVIENMAGVSETFVETHEEAAEIFSILSYVLGGISLIGFWASFTKKSFSDIIMGVTVVFALITLFFAQKAGTTGGEIRHPEIRAESTQSAPNPQNEGNNEIDD